MVEDQAVVVAQNANWSWRGVVQVPQDDQPRRLERFVACFQQLQQTHVGGTRPLASLSADGELVGPWPWAVHVWGVLAIGGGSSGALLFGVGRARVPVVQPLIWIMVDKGMPEISADERMMRDVWHELQASCRGIWSKGPKVSTALVRHHRRQHRAREKMAIGVIITLAMAPISGTLDDTSRGKIVDIRKRAEAESLKSCCDRRSRVRRGRRCRRCRC